MSVKKEYRSDLPERINIDVIDSCRAYENYGDSRIINYVFGFVHSTTREFCEDYIGDVILFIKMIEKYYILNQCGVLGSYESNVLGRVRKGEGCCFPQYDTWHADLMVGVSDDFVLGEIKKDSVAGQVPVFQIRRNWEIEHGAFCHRCGQESHHQDDYQIRVRGRFGFGFVPEDKILSRKRILFRKYG